jgi:hypothetical protein
MSQLVAKEKQIALLDMLDRILNKGVILWGDITISVADIDLVYVGLKVLLTSVETAERMRDQWSVASGQWPVAQGPTTNDQQSTITAARDSSFVVRRSSPT